MRVFFNVLLQSLNWSAAVFGAAKGYPYFGVYTVLCTLPIHFYLIAHKSREFQFMLICSLFGSLFDSLLVVVGAIQLGSTSLFGMLTAPWMIALWFNFMTLPNVALKWLRGNYLLGALLGAVLGPAAYYIGAQIGAISFHENILFSLLLVSVEWVIAMIFILKIQIKLFPEAK